ncbi:MAG: riboflavin synthase [Quisquiliibacterium sp.]
MFTGIVAAVGRIEKVEPLGDGLRLVVDAGALDLSDVAIGDSIAIQGACMTAVAIDGNRFTVEVSRESLNLTVGLDAPGEVNLEKALTLADRLGGHLVSGHVDGLGEVARFEPVGESWRLDVRVPAALSRYFAYKGSATINGTSLTVNSVVDEPGAAVISINLIPHTISVTTLRHLKLGDRVNLEVDLIARYVERMLAQTNLTG